MTVTFGGKWQEFFGAIWRAGGLKRPVPPGSRHDVNSYGRMVRVPVDLQREQLLVRPDGRPARLGPAR
jgi:hypothetical protein